MSTKNNNNPIKIDFTKLHKNDLKSLYLQFTLYAWTNLINITQYNNLSLCELLYSSRFAFREVYVLLFTSIVQSMIQLTNDEIDFHLKTYIEPSPFFYTKHLDKVRLSLFERQWTKTMDINLLNIKDIIDKSRGKFFDEYIGSINVDEHGPILWLWILGCSTNPYITTSDFCNVIACIYKLQPCSVCRFHMNKNYKYILTLIREIENHPTERFKHTVNFHNKINEFLKKPIIEYNSEQYKTLESIFTNLWK